MLRSIVLPAYNEGGYIEQMIGHCIAAMETASDPFEIIVVDNASSDRTVAITEAVAARDPRVRLVAHPENRLYAGSCRSGTEAARGERIFILDSDGQHDPADVWAFDAELDAGHDLVLGWRRERRETRARIVLSRVLLLLARGFIGFRLHDINCGMRGFSRHFAEALEIRHRVNMVNPELWTRATIANMRIAEVAIVQHERKAGTSSQEFTRAGRMLADVLRYFSALRGELRAARSSRTR